MQASVPYRSAGRFAWHFSRSKLTRDPVFVALLEQGLIPDARRLVDLGCGQGLLASWLRAARTLHDAGNWPSDWPAPPRIGAMCRPGIDAQGCRARAPRRWRAAQFAVGDIRTFDFGQADVVVILDVLHYIEPREQIGLLRRVRAALPPGGVLVTRVGDDAGGLAVSRQPVGRSRGRLCPRSPYGAALLPVDRRLGDACSSELGFRVDALPMSRSTPFANVLLMARVPRVGSRRTLRSLDHVLE